MNFFGQQINVNVRVLVDSFFVSPELNVEDNQDEELPVYTEYEDLALTY